MIRRIAIAIVVAMSISAQAHAAIQDFTVREFSGNEFRAFIEIFSEMRGPLRKQILKDRKTDFENADPLNYVMKVKDDKDVKRMLVKHEMSWDAFTELMGNVLLAYYTIQPQMTKVAIVRRLAGYGLMLSDEQIPTQYRPIVEDILKTDAGAAMASMILDMVLQVPPENIEIVKGKKITLDKMFYTRFWKNRI